MAENSNFLKSVICNQQANQLIKDLIEKNEPLLVARFGAVELSCVMNYISFTHARESLYKKFILQLKQGDNGYWKGWSEEVRMEMRRNAGFFPTTDEMLGRFAEMMLGQMKELNVLGVWKLLWEKELREKYFKDATCVTLESIEPYYHADPWSKALKGKKVLVIHPFEESITANYKIREKLFSEEVLPEFELKTLKAVQSIANNNPVYTDWFDALDAMCKQIDEIEFDIAIIGAGAYGLPLAWYVKKLGKQAIHMGGPTQILFGIKGARWDNRIFFKHLYNPYWTRPLPSEMPQNYEAVEKGCYW